jgi:hypothetical protein
LQTLYYVNVLIVRAVGSVGDILESMPKPGDNIRIPLSERDALAGLLAVRPTADMPRPGANPTGKKKPKKKTAR